MTILFWLILFQCVGNVSVHRNGPPFLETALFQHALPSTQYSLTSTMMSRAQAAKAALQARKDEDEKRLQLKKTRLEETQATREIEKAMATREAERVEEAIKNSVSPDPIDKPDGNINNYLSALNNPVNDKNNNNMDDDTSNNNMNKYSTSPVKNKRKTSHQPKLKSVLKNPKSNVDPLDGHIHKHHRTLISASVIITGADNKERTLQNVMKMKELFEELQSIDDSLRLNHLYNLNEHIWKSDQISTNQTKFCCYFNISSFNNKNPFIKQRQYNNNNNKKKKNEEAELKDPTIYFQFAISCDVEPSDILERVRPQWFYMEGQKLEVKLIQALKVFPTHVIWNMTSNDTEAIAHELRTMMKEVREINYDENNFDDPDPSRDIPSFSLTFKQPRLTGLNTKAYSKLSFEEQNHRRAIHIECSDEDANFLRWLIVKMKKLTRFGEDKPLIQVMWGKFVLVSEVLVTGKTSQAEIKNMNKMAQYHSNYSSSMSHDSLTGVTNLDTKVVLLVNEELNLTLYVTLREALLTWFAYPSDDAKEKEHRLFAEVHQGGNPGDGVSIVTPNTPEAENLIVAMNKNFAVILKSILKAQGIKDEAINELLRTSVCSSHVAQMNNYNYDEQKRILTSIKDNTQEKALEDFALAPWFTTKFNIDLVLNEKKKSNEDRPPPELLFNIDGDRSMVTIHDKSRKQEASNSGPKKISKVAFEVDESSSSSSNSKSENDNSSSSFSLDSGESNKGSTPSLSNARSNSTALKVIEHTALTLDNAQDSTMGG